MKELKPRLFVGSAGESKVIANKIQLQLLDDAQVTVWNQNVVKLGDLPWSGSCRSWIPSISRYFCSNRTIWQKSGSRHTV